MGLKLKWFRRRITFEGIPSAPERNTRKKEHSTGITVIGVYRQSVNYEDYIEPTRSSYWTPPSQPIATTTVRSKPTTSTNSPATSSRLVEQRFAKDKITLSTKGHYDGRIETPPEPSYLPPNPPVRRGLSKTKSTPNISALEPSISTQNEQGSARLDVTRSIEVLNDSRESESETPITPAPRTTGIKYNQERQNGWQDEDRSWSPPADAKLLDATKLSERNGDSTSADLWKHQQPDFFSEILEKVNDLANTTRSSEPEQPNVKQSEVLHMDPIGSLPLVDDDLESYDDIFAKVKAKPKVHVEPVKPNPTENASTIVRSESSKDIFEPRPPETISTPLIDVNPTKQKSDQEMPTTIQSNPRQIDSTPATKPVKSILKKRAPVAPQQQTPTPQVEVPTPPPRSIRKENPTTQKASIEDTDDDGDDYLNWNLVERHRSSINPTMAIDPEIRRNLPASLKTVPTASTRQISEEPPRTLRGMRNRTANSNGLLLGLHARSARDSASNDSEASA